MDSDKLLNLATSLGCLLAESGAEISRVEESVYRLLQAYQGKDAQVFAIPSCLIVSLMAEDGRPVTRMRRISAHGTDLELLERCNALCRHQRQSNSWGWQTPGRPCLGRPAAAGRTDSSTRGDFPAPHLCQQSSPAMWPDSTALSRSIKRLPLAFLRYAIFGKNTRDIFDDAPRRGAPRQKGAVPV
ncbi:MAG: threonine/serine exporter family protein [Dysosmobacter sp.]